MTTQDITAILSAGGAIVSAITAYIAVNSQIKAQKDLQHEKHKLAQGKFCCTGYNLSGTKISYEINNQGMYPISDIRVEWAGNELPVGKVEYPNSTSDKFDFRISLDFQSSNNLVLEDYIKILYKDIYDNECISKKKIKLSFGVVNGKIDFGNIMFTNE